MQRLRLVIVLLLLTLVASACYKDAGEDLQPTSRQVDLTDIAPTTPAPPTLTNTALPTAQLAATVAQPAVTATRTLVPTTTPADIIAAPPADVPEVAAPEQTVPADDQGLDPTPQQLVPPGMTVEPVTPTPTEILITTPGMNDILPTETPVPTRDPATDPLATTPTAFPIEETPCVHVDTYGDTVKCLAYYNVDTLEAMLAVIQHHLSGNRDK
ncbi:MAG: hypothetical protein K8S97_09015, partial [Anaerolineae bacterium]|nr:hypothetical protein [Anaerolineae bacterium]